MTVGELIKKLSSFGKDEPVWVYEPLDANEPYQAVASVEKTEFGEITIFRE